MGIVSAVVALEGLVLVVWATGDVGEHRYAIKPRANTTNGILHSIKGKLSIWIRSCILRRRASGLRKNKEMLSWRSRIRGQPNLLDFLKALDHTVISSCNGTKVKSCRIFIIY